VDFEVEHDPDELKDAVSVMRKLVRVRDVVLAVNREYIRSAAQAEDYRTEPPFKLQGSYRNMNRMAERVHPVMNDAEVEALIRGHYESDAQVLAEGAEANLLKLREILGWLTPAEQDRWAAIKGAFARNLLLRGADPADKAGQAIAQISGVSDGMREIRRTLEKLADRPVGPAEVRGKLETALDAPTLAELRGMVQPLTDAVASAQRVAESAAGAATAAASAIESASLMTRAPRTGPMPALKETESEIILTPAFIQSLDEELELIVRLMRATERPGLDPEERKSLLENMRQAAANCRDFVAHLSQVARVPLSPKG
jgi:hypothetical protein